MSSNEYLKDSYKSQLNTMAVVNVFLFWCVAVVHADFSSILTKLGSISIKTGLTGLIAPIGAFILDGFLSADTKARVVFWRYSNPLPGNRAFSVHLEEESRADPVQLANQWGGFPDEPTEQNRLWYRIYRSVEEETRVHEAHRAWLMARDLTAYAFLIMFVFGIAALISDVPWTTVWIYLVFVLAQYLTAMVAARNRGIRFVRTVLAVASSSNSQ